MSAGICGKRVGLDETFGSNPSSSRPVKKLRCCGSSDFGFGSEDKVSFLIQMFPDVDREIIETVLRTHEHNIDDAIKSLHSIHLGDDPARNESAASNTTALNGNINAQTSEHDFEEHDNKFSIPDSSWVDIFVHEMANASNMEDARNRTIKFLDAFGRRVVDNSTARKEQDIASLKEQLQCLLRDNQILKKAFALQHQKNLEYQEKLTEVQQLKLMLGQYQDQIRKLEMSNYSLQLHLQRAYETSSIPGRFYPDIF